MIPLRRFAAAAPRLLFGLLAWLSLGAGLALAAAHPLLPWVALVGFAALLALTYCKPASWLFFLPALLPFANWSPWTGWLIFEEFDLLLLAVLAGAYGARALAAAGSDGSPGSGLSRNEGITLGLLALSVLLALLRGFADAGTWNFGWFQGYFDPMNTLRVGKSVVFALLLFPLLQTEIQRNQSKVINNLVRGMLVGLLGVTLAVCWERALFPGLFNFSQPYRTTALFWEMHVGGAALDGYLVLAAPFALWAVLSARRFFPWLASALLALLCAYACLTTFARGVYLGIAVSLALFGFFQLHRHFASWSKVLARIALYCLGGLLATTMLGLLYWYGGFGATLTVFFAVFLLAFAWPGQRAPWIKWGGVLLLLALAIEIVVVLYGGSFMLERVAASNRDFGQRLQHWRNGINLLTGAPDWLLGKGLGRLPAQYSRTFASGESPGRIELVAAAATSHLRLYGPQTRPRLSGLFALSQRVAVDFSASVQVEMDVRLLRESELYVQVCEKHLLYAARCLDRYLRLAATGNAWRHLHFELQGPATEDTMSVLARPQFVSLSLLPPGTVADIDNIAVISKGENVLRNGDFSAGLQRWLPTAQSYFIPWHIDNLYLELLVERGLLGLMVFCGLLLLALQRLACGAAAVHPLSPYVLAALIAYLIVGLVSSLLDVPRVALLFHLLLMLAFCLPGDMLARDKCT